MKNLLFVWIASMMSISSALAQDNAFTRKTDAEKTFEITKSDEEWRKILSEEEYEVLRNKGTEYAFSGKYYLHKEKGVYVCAACGNELFSSKTKYNSGSGWPSFFEPISKGNIVEVEDRSMGMVRIEVLCGKCGSHLGHVFPDGPKPTGLRYCVNSISLDFKKEEKK